MSLDQVSDRFVAVLRDCCLHFCPSGVPDRGSLFGDGFLHVIQSDRRNDRPVHRSGASPPVPLGAVRVQDAAADPHGSVCDSGADVSVGDPGSHPIRCGLSGLLSGKLPAAHRNSRTSSAGENPAPLRVAFSSYLTN